MRVQPPAHAPVWSVTSSRGSSATLAQEHRALEFPTAHVVAPIAAPQPELVESQRMFFTKHLAQLGVVASVLWFLLRGADDPFTALAYAGLALTFLAVVSHIDRRRFEDADPNRSVAGVVDVVEPEAPMVSQQPWLMADLLVQQQLAAVAPLQQFLQAELVPVEVT